MLRLSCERLIWLIARNVLWNVEFSPNLMVLESASLVKREASSSGRLDI
jgi:hypothetical protein